MAEVYVKSGEAAKMLGVSVGTLGRWYDRGILKPAQVFPSGRRRYSVSQLQAFIREHEQQNPLSDDDGELYLTSKEVIEYAGLSTSMLNSLERSGHLLPRRRIPTSKKRLYAKSDVDAFLESISKV